MHIISDKVVKRQEERTILEEGLKASLIWIEIKIKIIKIKDLKSIE